MERLRAINAYQAGLLLLDACGYDRAMTVRAYCRLRERIALGDPPPLPRAYVRPPHPSGLTSGDRLRAMYCSPMELADLVEEARAMGEEVSDHSI